MDDGYVGAWFDATGPSDYPIGIKLYAVPGKHYITIETAEALVESLITALEQSQTVVEESS